MRQPNGHGRGSRSGGAASRPQHREQQHVVDSSPRSTHRGAPAMSAERFLLIVGQLEARANELWEQEQAELQRGAELMVLCCPPPPASPPHEPEEQQVELPVTSPNYFDHPALLHPHPGILQSPSLIPAANHFGSPGGCWSNDLDIAAQLGFGPSVTHIANDPADLGPSALSLLHASDFGAGPLHGQHHHHQQHQQQEQHHPQQLSAGGWGIYDAEALLSIPHPSVFAGGGSGAGGGGCGGSATARAAKARLLERFDLSSGGLGTATANQPSSASPFFGLFSSTPVADDFLGSPQSWARSYY